MPKISPCRAHHQEIVDSLARGEDGLSIARRLGLSGRGLQQYMQRRGGIRAVCPHGKRWIKLPTEQIDSMLQAGLTHPQIAEALGVSRDTILRRTKKLGLQSSRRGPRAGSGHAEWKEGRRLDKHGYVLVYAPLHPQARSAGCVAEHRLLMEVLIGRYLLPTEVVHHGDDHPRHNWIGNLGLFSENASHLRHELSGREKATPRSLIAGAYGSNQKNPPCPGEDETLALCTSETRALLRQWIERHRPTLEHRSLNRRSILRSGARPDSSP